MLWTQWVVAALGLLALAIALLPDFRSGEIHGRFLKRALGASLGLGALVAAALAWVDLDLVLTQREAARQMLPGLGLPAVRFTEWGARGLVAGAFTTLAALLVAALSRTSETRRRLLRFPPFWIGLFLFAWIACQSWNTWGVVVQRDLFWRILPREHITWIPSGLDAPFASDEEPGGMNGWRQLLILVGPWALLCALVAGGLGRRAHAWLAVVACVNGLGIALAGNLSRAGKWESFLGFADPDLNGSPFGPFVYKNQAGAYLCLVAGLTLALAFHLAKSRGDKADRGGPHLVAALAVIFLALGAASTMSLGALVAAAALLLVVAPAAYALDTRLRRDLSPFPALVAAALAGVVVYAGLLSADAKKWRLRVDQKQQAFLRAGSDDRAPLRRATWMMVEAGDASRRLSGWGGGSYRWTSPAFLRAQPEFLDRKGRLDARVTHAHNDWLQAIAEWGLAGWVVIAGILGYLARRLRSQWSRPSAPGLALVGAAIILTSHAFVDFLLFIPQLTVLALLLSWLLAWETPDDGGRRRWPDPGPRP